VINTEGLNTEFYRKMQCRNERYVQTETIQSSSILQLCHICRGPVMN